MCINGLPSGDKVKYVVLGVFSSHVLNYVKLYLPFLMLLEKNLCIECGQFKLLLKEVISV